MIRPSTTTSSSKNASGVALDSLGTQTGTSSVTKNPIFNTDRFGQHILKNPGVAQAIVDKANLKSTDLVLEVGPGTGNLTVRILDVCKKCTVVEMDPRMAAELTKRVQGRPVQRKLEITLGDFCKIPSLPYFDVCISNTPYQISSPLVFKLLSHRPLFRCAILMFQREFALRLLARPGSSLWCRLSANVQLYAKVDHIMKVSKGSFRPPPQVESSVVRIVPINPPPEIRFEEFDGLNRIVFSRRHKIVRSSFTASGVVEMLESNWKTFHSERERPLDLSKPFTQRVEDILQASGYSDQRAAQMDITDLLQLLHCFHEEGIHFS
ncbi:rrna adenine dimethylase [Ceraceosorus bombacis]|uniref:rRNA adenine N(6)-methyltransferase n=1 Tax=Ceraceosorus bombacis TaxID=401625 RepID=A0A0P1BCZ7_9BASI|nr:rrna adenine dimethylase [Ceraceosorus bombacis]